MFFSLEKNNAVISFKVNLQKKCYVEKRYNVRHHQGPSKNAMLISTEETVQRLGAWHLEGSSDSHRVPLLPCGPLCLKSFHISFLLFFPTSPSPSYVLNDDSLNNKFFCEAS